jgi:hypothetical protein
MRWRSSGQHQENHGMAKPYQVPQILAAISKLEEDDL